MAFEYTPVTAQNAQRQRDQYRPFQAVRTQNAGGSAENPNLMQVARAVKGLRTALAASQASSAGSTASSTSGVGYGLGQSLQAGELGSSTYAGTSGAVSGGTAAGSTASGASAGTSAGTSAGGSTLGSIAGGVGMGMNALGILQGMQTPQGVEGRDKGTPLGALTSAGTGAVSGFSYGGPVGALVGAGLGLESYQWQHGNRKAMTSIPAFVQSELTGGLAARDIGSWTGLWE